MAGRKQTVLITGATDGIGKETAFSMGRKGLSVLIHGKNREKGEEVRREISTKTGNPRIFYYNADFTRFDQIDSMAQEIQKDLSYLDVLVNNAGIYDDRRVILDTGIEQNFMVNYLAPFLLTYRLLDLVKGASGRIINVSSMIHANSIDFENLNGEKSYSGQGAYSFTKLCNILFTYELHRRINDDGVTVNALHPGVINTKLLHAGWGMGGASAGEAAERIT
jgi:NAD(P)-dependent dehydrogenase (short-subunit alcohol dehydrogenase family)